MDFNLLNNRIEKSDGYKFFKRHERVIKIIEGLIIIGLLTGIILFMQQDFEIKKQIKERCGYTTDKWECLCEKNYVEDYKRIQQNVSFLSNLNISVEDVEVDS